MTEEYHKTTIRMPLDLHKAARIKAIETNTTVSDVVRECLRLWVAGELELPVHPEEDSHEDK
jgi:hypothetical protein